MNPGRCWTFLRHAWRTRWYLRLSPSVVLTPLFLLFLLSGAVNADDRMNGHRLFFTPEQRSAATAATLQPVTPAMSEVTASAAVTRPPPRRFEVYFHALVSGPQGTRVLVNGLPCRWLDTSTGVAVEGTRPLHCPGVRRSEIVLSLSLSEGSITVHDGAAHVRTLVPGQRW